MEHERYVKKYTNPFADQVKTEKKTQTTTQFSNSEIEQLINDIETQSSELKEKLKEHNQQTTIATESKKIEPPTLSITEKFEKKFDLPPINTSESWTLFDKQRVTTNHQFTEKHLKLELEDGWKVVTVFSQNEGKYVDHYEGLTQTTNNTTYELIRLPNISDRLIITLSNRKNDKRYLFAQK